MKIKIKKFIEGVSKDEVMKLFLNPVEIDKVLDSIEKVEILSDVKSGKGVKWRETRVMFGKEATEVMWISEVDKNEIVIEANSMGTEYISTYTFLDSDGGVEVEFEFYAKPVSLMAKFMTPVAMVFKSTTSKALESDLDEIKNYFEK